MKQIIYNKDKKVKIFYLLKKRNLQGNIITVKKYIHPLGTQLSAYFRDLSQKEIAANKQLEDTSTAQAIVNRRLINNTMYLEYKRRNMGIETYNINGVDFFDDSTSDIKLSLSKVTNKIAFDEEEGTEWN